MVHTELLCNNSPFFKSALGEHWKEKKDNLIKLPDDDITTFDLYLDWIYDKQPFGDLISCALLEVLAMDIKEIKTRCSAISHAWIFGDKVLDYNFCDAAIDAMIGFMKRVHRYPQGAAFSIYKATGQHAPARQLLIDMFLYVANPTWYIEGGEPTQPKLDAEAYAEITRRFVLSKGVVLKLEDAPWNSDPCAYHWHKKHGGICYKDRAR